ncbi:alkaline phosphatase family protein [Amycolatopsis benzoatilytica]|uniref:alkaline phosphatase family protein n=1 Tax=Amycolatopsis benzoatilytica TaxID=346045 RepID=UPI000361467E|nr:alkaline phosphatase family protein [Amycolatopsis benzoatilytica]
MRSKYLAAAVLAAASVVVAGSASAASTLPSIGHVFVINLENKGYDETWGPGSAAPYLSQTLRAQGVLLTQYYGIGHNSLDNYVAQISGQGPNSETQADCQVYDEFQQVGSVAPGQAVGQGCVYPASVPTLPGQLAAAGLTWKAYLEDMGTSCRHPAIGAVDDTQKAKVGDQYAARHNPFVYFHSVIDTPACAADVDLSALPGDLSSPQTTANLTYITPNLCHDAHDAPCVDGEPGGLVSADAWLRQWVPQITSSPAFGRDGMLVIAFDESDGPSSDSSACCGEGPGPNAPLPGITGLGGGRTGALVLSKYTAPGSWNDRPYNHYSLLASIENQFGLSRLGYAASSGVTAFGLDVFNR